MVQGVRMTMVGRFVHRGGYVLTAAALLLAVVCSVVRPHHTPSFPTLASHNIIRHRQNSQFADPVLPSSRALDFLPADFKNDTDADSEDEVPLTSELASYSFDLIPSNYFQPRSERFSRALRCVVRPIRC